MPPDDMSLIAENLQRINARITLACQQVDRDPKAVHLIAVSKTHSAESVRQAYDAGQRSFGENYSAEAISKIQALADIRQHLTWHFIGPVQSNKTRLIAEHFDWVQSVDRLKIAQRLSDQRPADLGDLNICLQVNISKEDTKSGVLPEHALQTSLDIAQLPRLALRGLMAIPQPGESLEVIQHLQHLFLVIQEQLKNTHQLITFDTISVGMSDDLERAIAGGSTMVRIGTAIFGSRVTPINTEKQT
jgi:hypothetical protein